MQNATNKQTNKDIKYVLIGVFLVIVLCICGLAGYKFIKHERSQQSQITSLTTKVNELEAEIEIINNKVDNTTIEWEESSYKYLAIGNSITRHPINEYWWNEAGMAATTLDNDYVHVFSSLISIDVGNVDVKVTNLSGWEASSNDRAEFIPLIDPYLSSELDLVTIQLGENVQDTTTLESDFEELIRYVKDKCPNARILVIGQYWQNDVIDEAKKEACNNTNVEFVDLSSMFDKEDSLYNAGMGTIVYDAEGNEHTIDHSGVAIHPGDEGMKEIARLVYEVYKK